MNNCFAIDVFLFVPLCRVKPFFRVVVEYFLIVVEAVGLWETGLGRPTVFGVSLEPVFQGAEENASAFSRGLWTHVGNPPGEAKRSSWAGFPHASIAPGSPVNSTAFRERGVAPANSVVNRIMPRLSAFLPGAQGAVQSRSPCRTWHRLSST